jgi:hypothetical protein
VPTEAGPLTLVIGVPDFDPAVSNGEHISEQWGR